MIAGLSELDARRPAWLPEEARIADWLGSRQPMYRYRKPCYQVRLLEDLAKLMPAAECRVLDIGAGSGLLGEAIETLFPGKQVTGVDTRQRSLPRLRIPFAVFDGRHLPFDDAAFGCALLCNVLHHVRRGDRLLLLREALRVAGDGPVLIKDHIASTPLDWLRLVLLDLAGNLPFGGMVTAHYLGGPEWGALLREAACSGAILPTSAYRNGLSALCFPNALEVCFSVTQSRSTVA